MAKKKTAKTAAGDTAVQIPTIDVQQMQLRVEGDSPLIVHAWSEKAKKEMLDKQMKKAKTAKMAKDPWLDFCDSMYWITKRPAKKPTEADVRQAKFGFPCVAFKAAAVGACRFADGVKMTEARGAFHVVGELVEIESDEPEMREDMVRIGQGTADIRFRGAFNPWAATITVAYNVAALTAEQIINLFNLAGFGVGVGEWRPEKDGSYGRFHVV